MMKTALSLILFVSATFGQYKTEPAAAPPSELDPAIVATLQKQGVKVLNGDKLVCEIWFRNALPTGAKSAEANVTLSNVPHGSLLGAIRFPERGSDRRGQQIKPGVYTMRFSMFPQNGDHQGVAPQRDFLLLSPAADDKDPNAAPTFEVLVKMSQKASGTQHPAVFSFWKAEASAQPGIKLEGEHDWVLNAKIGDTPISMIVVGRAEG
jgi:hypothetical protein